MVRIIIKGGVWKNTEDEILKAAISKYGKNQWARISSLLVRKTPKQCKARWYEWLDPSIKKTEWSKEEDEKLLHLAKLMPTQWRTIAPIVGRTATQCLERYQKLLDEAEQRENDEGGAGPSGSNLTLTGPSGGESAPTAEEVRRLRPGEIDPDPETKPARPDAVDMDEDEKEMLSEARARLANTQGKKAKRKARERALEEARRLAMLQKKRELKAAGINVRQKKPKKGMDYMTDIPFEKQPTIGFYDTSEEDSRAIRAPIGRSIGQMDNPDKAKREEDEKLRQKKEAERKKQSEEGKAAFSKQREEQLRKLQENEQISKRRKLNLPEAQVGQRELDEIVKLGMASESAHSLVAGPEGGDESSRGLLGNYPALEHARDARTPRTAPQDDTVMREARSLRNLANLQTPLLGGANMATNAGTGRSSATPSRQTAQTPNPLLTPRNRIEGREDESRTPQSNSGNGSIRGSSVASTPLRTPLRDSFGLNIDENVSMVGGVDSSRDLKRAAQAARARLQQGFLGLPAPKNDFELVLDEEQNDDSQKEENDTQIEEDEADREAKLAKLEEEERTKEFARRSQVVQRNLPRPANVNLEAMLKAIGPAPPVGSDVSLRVHHLIAEEMAHLAKHDSVVHPIAGSTSTGGMRSGLPIIPDEKLSIARELVRLELASQLGIVKENKDAISDDVIKKAIDEHLDIETEKGQQTILDFEKSLKESRNNMMWNADKGVWCDRSTLDSRMIVAGQSARLEAIRKEINRLANQATKEEKKLGKLLGGYQARSKSLAESILQSFRTMSEGEMEKEAYKRLREIESVLKEERISHLLGEVNILERREKLAQGFYHDHDEERKKLQREVEMLEDEIAMREAEHLNDAALQES